MIGDIPLANIPGMVGQELGVSEWHEITQKQINAFAEATGDFQWMHVDVERANREMGGTIAHGLLTLSLLPALSNQFYRVTEFSGGFNYGFDKLRFTRPVKVGSKVRLRLTLTDAIAHKNNGIMPVVDCVMEVQGEEAPALVTSWKSLFYP